VPAAVERGPAGADHGSAGLITGRGGARSLAFVRAQAGRFTSGQRLQNVIAGNY